MKNHQLTPTDYINKLSNQKMAKNIVMNVFDAHRF